MDGTTALGRAGRRPRAISMFSGMEAASVAAHPLGWDFVAFAEVEPAACHTLHHHYGCGRPVHLPRPEDADGPKDAKDRAARIRAVAALPEAAPGAPVNVGDMTQVDWASYRGQVDVVVGGPPCFPAGALILSKRGLVPVEDIRVGDEVLTHKLRWRRVLVTMAKESETVVLKGQGHWGLETTAEHPFWSRKSEFRWVRSKRLARELGLKCKERFRSEPDWTEAKDMRGKHWAAPADIPFEGATDILREASGNGVNAVTPEFMWVLGAWLGDGWTRRRIVDGRNKHEFIICAGNAQAGDLAARLTAAGFPANPSDARTTAKFSCGNSRLVEWVHRHFGQGAEGKKIPSWMFGLPRELRVALLEGYCFADGHTQKGAKTELSFRRFTTVSRGLAVGIRMLVNTLGFGGTVMHYPAKRDACVIEGRTVSELPQFQVAYFERSRSAYADAGMIWGCVREIRPTGETKRVYNFEVEEDNSYVVDGIVVHNCQAFSFAGLRRSLDDDRGNLSLAYVRAIHAIEPLWSFTENVPGWLSTKDNAFGCYLGALVGADSPLPAPAGGRWGSAGVVDGPLFRAAWRVLDAQGFVPQRRRRVFVVAARVGTGGDPVRVLFESEAEVELHLGARAHRGPLFPVGEGRTGNPRARGEAGEDAARDPARGAAGGGGADLSAVEEGERGLLGLVPQGYRIHAAFSTAMTSGGDARVADPVQSTRALDTCGGFATNQGGNIVVQPLDEPLEEWIPETSTTLRARDAKGSPDSDCTQTLIAIRGEAPDAIAFHARQDPDSGDVTHALDTDGYSIGVLAEAGGEAADAYFLHCNKGRPAGRKSAHEEMVSVKDIVETLTTDGHAQSAVAHSIAEVEAVPPLVARSSRGGAQTLSAGFNTDGHVVAVEVLSAPPAEPLAFSSKDHGADVGHIAPTLRAAPHHLSHPNSGSHVAICMVAGEDGSGLLPGEARIFQDSEFGVAEYDSAGTLRAGRIPEHQMILEAVPEATVYDDPRRFDTKGIHGGGDHGEVHPTLESTNPKQIACIRDGEAGPARAPGAARRIWMLVRRLTPTECLALQGFPRGYLDGVVIRGKPLADGPKYKMAGNSWCVPLIRWVFGRLDGAMREQIGRGE